MHDTTRQSILELVRMVPYNEGSDELERTSHKKALEYSRVMAYFLGKEGAKVFLEAWIDRTCSNSFGWFRRTLLWLSTCAVQKEPDGHVKVFTQAMKKMYGDKWVPIVKMDVRNQGALGRGYIRSTNAPIIFTSTMSHAEIEAETNAWLER